MILHGTVRVDPFGHDAEMENPHHEILKKNDASEFLSVRPVYERIASITPKTLRWIVKSSLESIPAQAFGEPLSDELRKKYKLVDRRTAIQQLHFPTSDISLEEAIAWAAEVSGPSPVTLYIYDLGEGIAGLDSRPH